MKSKDLFPAVFSRHAAAYQRRLEDVMERGEARGRIRVIELVDARPGMRVLDLACGPGTLSLRLARLVSPGGEVVGVDLAPGMIELAKAAGTPGARFEVMDVEKLTFPDASFDAAACGHGLQFAPDLGRALRETHRVLRPGASFAASVPLASGASGPWAVIGSVVDRWLPPAPQAVDQQPTRATVGDAAAFRDAALAAGFREAQIELVEEIVRWESADQLVTMFTSWWDCAARLEGIDPERRQGFIDEARSAMKEHYHGTIDTVGRNHVLHAVA